MNINESQSYKNKTQIIITEIILWGMDSLTLDLKQQYFIH